LGKGKQMRLFGIDIVPMGCGRGACALFTRIGLAALALLVDVGVAAAQATFDASRTDREIAIETVLEGRPVDASGQIQVSLRNAKGTVVANATPLKLTSSAGDEAIPKARITVEQKEINAGQTGQLAVTIRGINRAGVYQGNIDLAIDAAAATHQVKVTLRVVLKPQIEIAEKTVALSFSNCVRWCDFTGWISPGSDTGGQASLEVLNKSPSAINVTGTMLLKGTINPGKLASIESPPVKIEPADRGRVSFVLQRHAFEADRYSGSIFLTASADRLTPGAAVQPDGAIALENRTFSTVPATADVRTSAFLPFLIVLLGVIGGRLAKVLNDRARLARIDLYPQYASLKERIGKLRDPDLERRWKGKLETLWDSVLQGDATDAKFKQQFTNMTAALTQLEKIKVLTEQLSEPRLAAVKQAIEQKLITAQTLLLEDKLAEATQEIGAAKDLLEKELDKARTAVARAAPGVAPPGASPDDIRSLQIGVDQLTRTLAAQDVVRKRQTSSFRRFMVAVLQFLSGVDTTDTIAAQTFFIRPLVYMAFVILLSLYGLWLLYSGPEHPTFGSKGFSEYMGLLLWGFASQTVAMTIENIQFTRKS
jgi:hypothetical protein